MYPNLICTTAQVNEAANNSEATKSTANQVPLQQLFKCRVVSDFSDVTGQSVPCMDAHPSARLPGMR